MKRLSGSPQGQPSVISIRKSTRPLCGETRQQESKHISVVPAQLSLPRSKTAGVEGGSRTAAEGGRARRRSGPLLLGSASCLYKIKAL